MTRDRDRDPAGKGGQGGRHGSALLGVELPKSL